MRGSIATKLLFVVMYLYLLVKTFVSVVHIFLEYEHQKETIMDELYVCGMTFRNGLAVSIWDVDPVDLRVTIDGMLNLPSIEGIKIMDVNGTTIASAGTISEGPKQHHLPVSVNFNGISAAPSSSSSETQLWVSGDLFEHTFELSYRLDGLVERLGEVTLYSSNLIIFKRTKLQALMMLVNTVVTSITFAVALLWAVNRYLRHPLNKLTSVTSQISLETLDDFTLTPDPASQNETKELEDTIFQMVENLRDSIDQRNTVQLSLNESEQTLREIIDNTEMVIYLKNIEGKYLLINKQFESIFSTDRKLIKGKKDSDILPAKAAELFWENDKRVIHEGQAIQFEELVHCGDSEINYLSAKFPLRRSSGEIYAICSISTDITERKKIEKIMIQSEKMQSVAGLAAGMAHEINNPLAIITQGIQNSLRRLSPENDKNIEAADQFGIDAQKMYELLEERKIITFLGEGIKAVNRAADIVRNMLTFSRRSDTDHIQTNLADLLDHSINLGASDYDMQKKYDFKFVEINKEYDPDLPAVNCCPGEIEQVLLNLFKNAIQAMDELTIEGYKPQFYIRLIKEEDFVRIEIEDNGPGMSQIVQNRVFEPFFTTKPVGMGTGLGLSVSYMIITQNHGGTFEVESELARTSNQPNKLSNGRTQFTIRLPL